MYAVVTINVLRSGHGAITATVSTPALVRCLAVDPEHHRGSPESGRRAPLVQQWPPPDCCRKKNMERVRLELVAKS